jgi:hypothetical protein
MMLTREKVWDSNSPSTEIAQGKAIADAALAVGVTVMIFSSLPSISKMSNGEVASLPQFDSKAVVEEYIRGLSFPVSVFYLAGWYMQNIWHEMAPQVQIVCSILFFAFLFFSSAQHAPVTSLTAPPSWH